MRVLVTGSAGFVGYHVAQRLLNAGHVVTGFDGMTPYYDIRLKQARHDLLGRSAGFTAIVGQLEDMAALQRAVEIAAPDVIVHLAAQAGVRHSIEQPRPFAESNLIGSFNVLEVARSAKPAHLLMASTSSVYGANVATPFEEAQAADLPLTLYAATKKAMEGMSHAYAHLFGVPTTCFRFFTVYGPWGRPDMALFKFVEAISRGEPIDVYGEGRPRRDFTYVDDLVDAIERLIAAPPVVGSPVAADGMTDTLSPVAPWRVVNIGGGEPVDVLSLIETIERCVGKAAIRRLLPIQPGDMLDTCADYRLLQALTGYRPRTSLEDGVRAFVDWRRDYAGADRGP